jgi:D-alanine--poly(phosphoribitol) ligase subunit 1
MTYSFLSNVIQPLLHSFRVFGSKNAFFISGKFYTYDELARRVSAIRNVVHQLPDIHVGLVANDDLETYASIFALWLEGKCYVPLHPFQPLERCEDIISQVGMTTILDSDETSRYTAQKVIMTRHLSFDGYAIDEACNCGDDADAYVLFTSGSTGKPKGVPLTRGNLSAFVDSFFALGYQLDKDDRCLQMFDLTFDLSVQSYLIPMLVGACAYTVPSNSVKYMEVFQLLDEQRLTFALMVPSIIHYMRPYLHEIAVPEMRYSLFCGEALLDDDTSEWCRSVPNARVDNLYGPTECTIYCTCYHYLRDSMNKEVNGAVCIGREMSHTHCIIVDEKSGEVAQGVKGELCLSGAQLTRGYWNNPEKNAAAFFMKDGVRYYRTGDLCAFDADGDILYYGRIDFQVKIQGYRVELGEIEEHARKFFGGEINAVAVVAKDSAGNNEIALCLESGQMDTVSLTDCLKSKLPSYMIPSAVCYIEPFPQNANGKIDRKQLAEYCRRQLV